MSPNPLPTQYQQYIHLSRYARWDDTLGRRETWSETVDRYIRFFEHRFPGLFPGTTVREAIHDLHVMPSMRALMTAGPALQRDEVAGFNCAYLPVDDVRAFDETLYILMCGTGVGFSVEEDDVAKLPIVAESTGATAELIRVEDSKIGWAMALRQLVSALYAGRIPRWDVSAVRPEGARLKTFGGRASGPGPLVDLFRFTVKTIRGAAGRRLTPLECHDLICKVAESVVVGGVRRSALISLSDLSDESMRGAKSGKWYESEQQRSLANNSAVYHGRPSREQFFEEWKALQESGSGERGIFNRQAAERKVAENGRRVGGHRFGTNPCGEIILRPNCFCNLTEGVIRRGDSLDVLRQKARIAAIIGTFQSTLTNYKYLRPIWRKNAEEERLLGVSLTGVMDHEVLSEVSAEAEYYLEEMRRAAVEANAEFAALLGIPVSAAITTVKPSGTVSQLVDSASGLHPRFSPHYIRSVRAAVTDPLAQFMESKGFKSEPDITAPGKTKVFYFPVKAPEGAVFREDKTAIEQLEHYVMMRRHWCEHNPSITVYVRADEWEEVGGWVYTRFDEISGVSFLPFSDHVYSQAPYTECTEETYLRHLEELPQIDWEGLKLFERTDQTTGSQQYACVGGVCELV